jgi:hypothetical protein
MLRIHVTRGPTSMGDDQDDHPWDLTATSLTTLRAFLRRTVRRSYLPMGWDVDWLMWIWGRAGDPRRAVALLHGAKGRDRPTSIDTGPTFDLSARLLSLAQPGEDGVLYVSFQFDPQRYGPDRMPQLG